MDAVTHLLKLFFTAFETATLQYADTYYDKVWDAYDAQLETDSENWDRDTQLGAFMAKYALQFPSHYRHNMWDGQIRCIREREGHKCTLNRSGYCSSVVCNLQGLRMGCECIKCEPRKECTCTNCENCTPAKKTKR